MKKKIVSIILSVTMCFGGSLFINDKFMNADEINETQAVLSENEDISLNKEKVDADVNVSINTIEIPQRIKDYIKEEAPVFVQSLIDEQDFYGIKIDNPDLVKIGEPIIVYRDDDKEVDEEPICFVPIFEGDKVIQSLVVVGDLFSDDGELGMQTSPDLVDEYNYLSSINNLSEDCYLIAKDENLYAISANEDINLTSPWDISKLTLTNNKNERCNIINSIKDKFNVEQIKIDLNKKFEQCSDMFFKNEEIIQNKKNTSITSVPEKKVLFTEKDGYGVIMQVDGQCWAAAVATVVNYKKKTNKYGLSDVYGIFNGNGLVYDYGDESDIIPALKEFGLSNYHEKGVTNSNFETIKDYCKKSVSMTYPVLVKVVPKDPNPDIGMHIINYIGYDKSNSKAYMYDPKPVNGKGVYKTVSDNSQNYYSEGYKFNTRWSRIYYGDNH